MKTAGLVMQYYQLLAREATETLKATWVVAIDQVTIALKLSGNFLLTSLYSAKIFYASCLGRKSINVLIGLNTACY